MNRVFERLSRESVSYEVKADYFESFVAEINKERRKSGNTRPFVAQRQIAEDSSICYVSPNGTLAVITTRGEIFRGNVDEGTFNYETSPRIRLNYDGLVKY